MARRSFFAAGEAGVEAVEPSPGDLVELGLKYCIGRDVELDLIEAHKWFNLAARRGNRQARVYRSEISEEMTKQEIFKAQRMAREWLRLHSGAVLH